MAWFLTVLWGRWREYREWRQIQKGRKVLERVARLRQLTEK